MMKKWLAGLLVSASFVLPGTGTAQAWLEDRADANGPGIRLGSSLLLHPGLGVEGGYDTNAIRNADGLAAGRLRITPYIDLTTRGAKRRVEDDGTIEKPKEKLRFGLGLAGFYDWYFSDEPAVQDQSDWGLIFRTNLVALPESAISFLVDAAYSRVMIPYESSSDRKAYHLVSPSAGIIFRPGGGTLSFELGYRLNGIFFEDEAMREPDNRVNHEARFLTSWKVFPKTAIMTKIYFSPIRYLGGDSPNEDSNPIRALFGLQGLVTDRMGLSLFVGYGAGLYDSGDDFDSVIANAELMFFITPTAKIRLGGQRDFVDSFYANFYEKNGGYLSYDQLFGGLFLTSLRGSLDYRYFRNFNDDDNVRVNPEHEGDLWASATLLLELRATDWLSFHLSGNYQANISDFETSLFDDTGAQVGNDRPWEFHQFVFMGGVRGHY
jgi:hypothetical protein